MKKTDPIKRIKKLSKEHKENRFECQKRVNEFNSELADKINRHNMLVNELTDVQSRISQLRHLIEMYRVMDDKEIFFTWKLELAAGLTTKSYPDWMAEFRKTKEGFNLKS